MRIILYLGKGGVGKTTIAAATAVRSAALGKRTLVVSTDLAHSLADCFNTPLSSEPAVLASNLWAQEVNVLDEMRHSWGKVQEKLSQVLRKRGLDSVMAEELALIPVWTILSACSTSTAMPAMAILKLSLLTRRQRVRRYAC